MRKTQFEQEDDNMDFEESSSEYHNLNSIKLDDSYLNFYSKSSNIYKTKSSYNINQITKNEQPNSLLKVKVNPNTPNEMALINSNFSILSMVIKEDSLFHLNTIKHEHTDRINDVCFFKNSNSPFNNAFISGSSDGMIKIWDSRSQDSIKTINASNGKKVFTLDTNTNCLIAGLEREIGVWELRMMKQLHKVKFAHSEDVTYVKVNNNIIISGGEDNIVNVFDIQNGLDMTSVLATVNVGQPVASMNFIDDDINYLHVNSTVHSFHLLNMWTGVSDFEFDAKNQNYKTDYILDSYYNKESNSIELFCGNFYGDIALLNINLNNKEHKLGSFIQTNVIQCFNSIDRVTCLQNCYVIVSDEGYLYLIENTNDVDKSIETLNDLKILEEDNHTKSKYVIDNTRLNDITPVRNNAGSFTNKINKDKKQSMMNRFSPY